MSNSGINPLSDALRGDSSFASPKNIATPGQFPMVDGLWFNQKVVKLDGWSFVGCRFDNCKIIIETPYFSLKNCYIDSTNQIEFQGVILNAMKLLNLSPLSGFAQYQAHRNADGTISIGV